MNLNTPNSEVSKQKVKKTKSNSFLKKSACYRGFTSIDQEMEREIAQRWFKPTDKNRFFKRLLFLGDDHNSLT